MTELRISLEMAYMRLLRAQSELKEASEAYTVIQNKWAKIHQKTVKIQKVGEKSKKPKEKKVFDLNKTLDHLKTCSKEEFFKFMKGVPEDQVEEMFIKMRNAEMETL